MYIHSIGTVASALHRYLLAGMIKLCITYRQYHHITAHALREKGGGGQRKRDYHYPPDPSIQCLRHTASIPSLRHCIGLCVGGSGRKVHMSITNICTCTCSSRPTKKMYRTTCTSTRVTATSLAKLSMNCLWWFEGWVYKDKAVTHHCQT